MRPTVLHGVEPVPQPSPGIHDGGDCFACAHLAILRHFWPDQAGALTVADVCEWWAKGAVMHRGPGKIAEDLEAERDAWVGADGTIDYRAAADIAYRDENTWGNDMHHAPRVLAGWETPFRLEVVQDPWLPLVDREGRNVSPIPYYLPGQRWHQRVEAYLAGGWVGYMPILHEPKWPAFLHQREDGTWGHTTDDHMVLLDGIRHYVAERYNEDGTFHSGTYKQDAHVVCSVKGGFWIEDSELLRMHGGMLVLWCRPRREPQRFRAESAA